MDVERCRFVARRKLKRDLKSIEKEAIKAEKDSLYTLAQEKYSEVAGIASDIFKLGVSEMTNEVKRLTNKSKELQKALEGEIEEKPKKKEKKEIKLVEPEKEVPPEVKEEKNRAKRSFRRYC